MAKVELNGSINYPDQKIHDPFSGKDIPIALEADFQNLKLSYEKIGESKSFNFDEGTWSFASPQKAIFNFPVTIENIEFEPKPITGNELYAASLTFNIVANLDDVLGGRTTIELVGSLVKPSNAGINAEFKGVNLGSIDIYANLAAVMIDGNITFNKEDEGVKGNVTAQFRAIELEVSAGVEFGTKEVSSGSSDRFRYWNVQAQVILPPSLAIPFLPGLAFRGFGAGAYRNMTVNYGTSQMVVNTSQESQVFAGANFTPANNNFGLKIKAVIATTPSENTFNADVGIEAEFNGSNGISLLKFSGAFYVGAKLVERNNGNAITHGEVNASYDFSTKIFYMHAGVEIDRPPIKTLTPATLNLYINGPEDKWYFKCGDALGPLNTVQVFEVDVQEYLMFGNDIQAPNSFMDETITGYKAATNGQYPGSVPTGHITNSETETGKGFAFGIGVKKDTGEKLKHITGRFSVKYHLIAGGEINLNLFNYSNSGNCSPIGIDGWYAKGSLVMYARGNFGIQMAKKGRSCTDQTCLTYCCDNYPNGKYFSLADVGFGAWFQGGFPNPLYLAGGGYFHYEVLNVIEGSAYLDFQIGNYCNNSVQSTNTSFTQEDAAADTRTKLIMHIWPDNNTTGHDNNTAPRVQYGFAPGEAFDVPERQSDGTVKNRTFRLARSVVFNKQTDSGSQPVVYTECENSIGEFVYYGMNPLQALNGTEVSCTGPIISYLQYNTDYSFTVTATLQEFRNNAWASARDKNNQIVSESQTVQFKTGNAPSIADITGGGKVQTPKGGVFDKPESVLISSSQD